MILSASRRTDIPAFYGEWFINRLKEGRFYVKNPYNNKLVSLIEIDNRNLDCIVFWTKDAIDFMKYLDIIDELNYNYYFHYTINPYHEDLEPLNHTKKEIIENFIELSNKIGNKKVILRYNPIIISTRYSIEYHIRAFNKLCITLKGKTEKVVISFLDEYPKLRSILINKGLRTPNSMEKDLMYQSFSEIAKVNDIKLTTCGEADDTYKYGIEKNSCIDKELIETISNKEVIDDTLDKTRDECLCLKCIDIGAYNTCQMGCAYCYAGYILKAEHHSPLSLLLNEELSEQEVKVRTDIKSILGAEKQITFDFDNIK